MGSSPWLLMWLCMVFCFVLLVGAVLFVIWASRLKQEQLWTWVMWLLAVGLVGCLITGFLSGGMMMRWKGERMMMNGGNMMMDQGMMDGQMMNGGMMNGSMMNQ